MKINADDYGQISTFTLQPLADIHLQSDYAGEMEPGGNATLVYSLIILAIIILVVAWVNYVNLSTALYLRKTRQFAIRKIIGATKRHLAARILTESALLNLLAFILSLLLVELLLPGFTKLVGVSDRAILKRLCETDLYSQLYRYTACILWNFVVVEQLCVSRAVGVVVHHDTTCPYNAYRRRNRDPANH